MMLVFVDQPKQIRVVRTETKEGVSSRAPIGRVMKHRMEITEDLKSVISNEEEKSVEQVIATYDRAEAVRGEFYSLNFPVIVREVMDRFEADASETERTLVMSALMEAVRRMRKYQRDGAAE